MATEAPVIRRFLLFCGASGHSRGGWDDWLGHFGSLEEARTAFAGNELKFEWGGQKVRYWAHVLDCESTTLVARWWKDGVHGKVYDERLVGPGRR